MTGLRRLDINISIKVGSHGNKLRLDSYIIIPWKASLLEVGIYVTLKGSGERYEWEAHEGQ